MSVSIKISTLGWCSFKRDLINLWEKFSYVAKHHENKAELMIMRLFLVLIIKDLDLGQLVAFCSFFFLIKKSWVKSHVLFIRYTAKLNLQKIEQSSNSFSCFTLEMNCSALHVFIHKIWKWHEWICTKEVQKEFINIYYANYIWLQGNYYLGKNILCKVKENSRMFTNYLPSSLW